MLGAAQSRRSQLAAFFCLAYGISWALWLGLAVFSVSITTMVGAVVNVLAIAGPSIAALLITLWLGRGRLRELLAGLSVARLSGPWLAVALILPPVLMCIAIAGSVVLLGAPRPHFGWSLVGVLAIEFVRVLFLGGPLGEEIGWRGFALPRLQQRRTALTSSVILGLVWGLWHIPLYFVPGTGQHEILRSGNDAAFSIGGFVTWTIGLSVLFTWLFNSSRGSLLVVIAFHTAVDLAAFLPGAVGSTGAAPVLNVVLTWLVAVVVILRYGRKTLS